MKDEFDWEKRADRLEMESFQQSCALMHVQCFAATKSGRRCSSRAWRVRRGPGDQYDFRPVCTRHYRARDVRWALYMEPIRAALAADGGAG